MFSRALPMVYALWAPSSPCYFLIPHSVFNHMTISHLNRAVDRNYTFQIIFSWGNTDKRILNYYVYKYIHAEIIITYISATIQKIGSLGQWLLLFTDSTLTCKKRVTWKLSKSSIAKKDNIAEFGTRQFGIKVWP